MIDGVVITPLKQFPDERGTVMHMLRNDSPVFQEFGEIYFSTVHPGAVKAWHFHHRQTLNYAVPVGAIKFVLYDSRENSPTFGQIQEITLGEDHYSLVTVPPLTWNGFQGISEGTALVANCATHPHDASESEGLDPYDPQIPYDWALRE